MCTWLKFIPFAMCLCALCVCVCVAVCVGVNFSQQHEEVVDVISSRPWHHNKFDLQMIRQSEIPLEEREDIRANPKENKFSTRLNPLLLCRLVYADYIIQICFVPISFFYLAVVSVWDSIFRMRKAKVSQCATAHIDWGTCEECGTPNVSFRT